LADVFYVYNAKEIRTILRTKDQLELNSN